MTQRRHDAPTIRAATGDCPETDEALQTLDALPPPPSDAALAAHKQPVDQLGDYELLSEIARGGMGVVYKARQRSLDRIVAVKMIRDSALARPEDVARFQSEAAAAARLRHPHIVAIHEVGQHAGRHFFSMDYIEGRSLAEFARETPLSPHAAASLVKTIADAVQAAHDHGILHRDLKPSNVLIDAHGQPHVTDFGLAKRLEGDSQLTGTEQILGTPSYMPPEQGRGDRRQIGFASDVYSLGAILYELLTGRPPFRGESPVATIRQVLESEPVSPRRLNPAVSRDLETICLKCLEKEPAKRYATAQALADELDRFVRGMPIQARPISALARSWRWCRRNRVLATTGAGGLVAALLAVATLAVSVVVVSGARNRAVKLATDNAALARNERVLREKADEAAKRERRERERVEANLYIQHIALAYREWLANHPARTQELLAACPLHLRGWEWGYLQRLCQRELLKLSHGSDPLNGIAFHPSERWLACGAGNDVQIWDLNTGQEVVALKGHSATVFGIAISRDGERLASASLDKTVKVWDLKTRKTLLTLAGEARLHSVAFSPDGKRIAAGEVTSTVRLWDSHSGRQLYTLPADYCYPSVAFSPDGKRLAAANANNAKLWDVENGREVLTLKGHSKQVLSVRFSRDGTRIASASADNTVKVWDASSGQPQLTLLGHTADVTSAVFSPSGLQIASAGNDRSLKIWDATTGAPLRTLRGHREWIWEVAYNPDGTQLASVSKDLTVKLWDVAADQEGLVIAHKSGGGSAHFCSRGQRIVSAGVDVRIFATDTGAQVRRIAPQATNVTGVCFSPAEPLIATANSGGMITLLDANTGVEIRRFQAHEGAVRSIAFTPEGKELASCGNDRFVKMWSVASGQEIRRFAGHEEINECLAVSRDGRLLAAAGREGAVRIWNLTTGAQVKTLHGQPGYPRAVSFTPDGKRIAAAGWTDYTIKVWDLADDREPHVLRGHSYVVYDVAFSPDGRRIASAGFDQLVKLWDASSGQELLTLTDHTGPVQCLDWSPRGDSLLTASGIDGTVRVYQAAPWREESSAKAPPPEGF
jgi:WD40 repeat protein/tRNA A-37 threonylcarbamoyl transferase component Bud32